MKIQLCGWERRIRDDSRDRGIPSFHIQRALHSASDTGLWGGAAGGCKLCPVRGSYDLMDVTLQDTGNTLNIASLAQNRERLCGINAAGLQLFFLLLQFALVFHYTHTHSLWDLTWQCWTAIHNHHWTEKAPKLHLLLLEWHNNYPSTQPAKCISPSWLPQPIAHLNFWELICHSQRCPSHFFLFLKWVLLSSQVSEDCFIIPA